MTVQGTEFAHHTKRGPVERRMLIVYHGEYGAVEAHKLELEDDQWYFDGEPVPTPDAIHLRREFVREAFEIEYDRRREARVLHVMG